MTRRLAHGLAYCVVAPLGLLALLAAASAFVLGYLGSVVCDCFAAGRSRGR